MTYNQLSPDSAGRVFVLLSLFGERPVKLLLNCDVAQRFLGKEML